jgi:hypothetical protein
MLTGYGYDFSILADGSENIDLLGLTPLLRSTVYYPEAELIGEYALPLTGRLIANVTLDLWLDDGDVITEDSVVITAASTAGNSSRADLVATINAALNPTPGVGNDPFDAITAALSGNKLMFTTLGPEFEILDTSEHRAVGIPRALGDHRVPRTRGARRQRGGAHHRPTGARRDPGPPDRGP